MQGHVLSPVLTILNNSLASAGSDVSPIKAALLCNARNCYIETAGVGEGGKVESGWKQGETQSVRSYVW